MAPVKVASVQAASVAYDLHASVAKLLPLVKEAAQAGARLAVFPEAYLGAYPRHLDFKIGARTDENREWFSRYVKAAVKIPDGAEGVAWLSANEEDIGEDGDFWAFQQLCKAARDNKINLSVGIIERSLVGATLWCSNVLISDGGVLLSKHRKLQPTAAERIVWSQGHVTNEPGLPNSGLAHTDNLAVAPTSIGKIGGLICWENFMPLARYALYQKGVEIYTAPTADGRPTWTPLLQSIAQEGRCFVVSANQYHGTTDFPSDYPANISRAGGAKEDVWCRGGSSIVDPLGNILAGPLWDKEGILYADIDIDTIIGAKLDFDPVGHYARSDILSLQIKQ
ncbi:Nitrilase/cyanide hydratase and apolipo protein N-acyltransferase [Leucosporidium creatinivorum]|uniref:Nitrilase/cyanide hydratase and apolipo protein N-acyltransferase n=1 Tax=Leucosporidium creatinivorum TaxID=106004 RepID=A0A1Y2G2A1_9BASI|nr:Nitrilase/cyanide hydratase and apolipo protein N-acyltransferase [Leucosporidium creatinivorum]